MIHEKRSLQNLDLGYVLKDMWHRLKSAISSTKGKNFFNLNNVVNKKENYDFKQYVHWTLGLL